MVADRQFLRLNDRWALAYDPRQWIVQYRGGKTWQSVSFIGSEKRVLVRALAEKGVTPTPDAQRALGHLPDSFREWYSRRDEWLNAPKPETLMAAE